MKWKVLAVCALAVPLSGCAAANPVDVAAVACEKELRYAVEQNVPGSTEEWLAYEMTSTAELQNQEQFDGGVSYTLVGKATLTAKEFPTKSVDFTCFVNYTDEGNAIASIHTINGECTMERRELNACQVS